MMNLKHYYLKLEVKDAAQDGLDIGISADMLATPEVAGTIGAGMGKTVKEIMGLEEKSNEYKQ